MEGVDDVGDPGAERRASAQQSGLRGVRLDDVGLQRGDRASQVSQGPQVAER